MKTRQQPGDIKSRRDPMATTAAATTYTLTLPHLQKNVQVWATSGTMSSDWLTHRHWKRMVLAFQAPSLSRYHRHFQEPQQLLHEMKAGSESPGRGQIPPVRAGRWPATASLLGSTNHPGIILKWDNALWAQTEALSSCCINQTSDFFA